MNRQEIKNAAKTKIKEKGAKWDIIWPILVIAFLESVLVSIFGGGVNVDLNNIESFTFPTRYVVATSIVSILMGIVTAGYVKYIINFVRTGNFDSNEIINTVKAKWVNILIANILTGVIIGLCSLLFVIPGIIMALAYAFVTYLVVDTDVSGNDALSKSREMMKGYKSDYFVFQLSFIGWYLLVPFTLGLILIWLYPYYTVANTIYYEKLKELRNAK